MIKEASMLVSVYFIIKGIKIFVKDVSGPNEYDTSTHFHNRIASVMLIY